MTEPGDNDLTEDGRELASKLLTETREELVRADTKAQILLAASGVVISVVIGGILSGHWRPHDLSCRAELVWWIGAGAAGCGVGALVFALWPRIGSAEGGRVRYFADIRTYKSRDALGPALNDEAARPDRDAEQLLALAPIVCKKYVAIKVAMGALAAGAALIIAAAVFG